MKSRKKSKVFKDLRKIQFTVNNVPHVLIYNETVLSKEDALAALKSKDYNNPAIAIMTEVQWKNVFNDGEM